MVSNSAGCRVTPASVGWSEGEGELLHGATAKQAPWKKANVVRKGNRRLIGKKVSSVDYRNPGAVAIE